jgi:hypothetical protein
MNNQALLIQGETIFGVNHIPLFGKSFFSTGSVGKNEVQFTPFLQILDVLFFLLGSPFLYYYTHLTANAFLFH